MEKQGGEAALCHRLCQALSAHRDFQASWRRKLDITWRRAEEEKEEKGFLPISTGASWGGDTSDL